MDKKFLLPLTSVIVSTLISSPTTTYATIQNPDNFKACQQIPQAIKDNFEAEGKSPYSIDNCSLIFEPLETKFVTKNAHGFRHELKIIDDERRVGMTEITESFNATVKVDMSNGGKTIIAQYHNGDKGTIAKVYVSDTEKDFKTSIDGIFEVYARITPRDKEERTMLLGTIKSGQTFNLSVKNEKGIVTISAFGKSMSATVANGKKTYLKFGNYLQSQNPKTGKDCGPPFEKCYKDFKITKAKVTMSSISYSRK